jgi:hypothetical protein
VERNPGGSVQSGEVAQQAKQQGQQLVQQARQQANDLASRGGEQVKSQLANQKHEASQRLTPVQVALRETAQQLRKQGQAPVAQYADKTSDQVERFSGYLRETEVDEMVEEARGFARSRPGLFLGGALALGFLGARFLKSSSQEAASGGNGEPIAALPPAEGVPTTTGRTPSVEPTPVVDGPVDGVDRPVSPRGI